MNRKVHQSLITNKPIVVHQGGTSSGKTYGILQYLFHIGAQNPKEIITVIAEDVPNLKSGAFRDAKDIWYQSDAIKQWYPYINKTDRIFTCINGTLIEFKSFQDEYDSRSGKRDRAFFNEANAIKFGIFEQINLRTKKQTIIDFNPSSRFWAHDYLQGREDVEWVVTTFRDNRFISPQSVTKILSYEPTPKNIARGTANEYRWRVYGMGEVGRLEGLVFPDFKVCSTFPKEYKWRGFGLDWGYANDPTALTELRLAGGQLYVKQHIYEKGLTNQDIARRIKKLGIDEQIIADSSEPKSIEELKREGIWIAPAVKGADSVMFGIQLMSDYTINVLASSKNLIEEFSSYIWQKNRDGQPSNKPIDDFNHGIDAIRYVLMKRMKKKKLDFRMV